MSEDRRIAQRVLETEKKGLDQLAAMLDTHFDAAIDTIAHCKGRVIVTGMGKSGHIGRKIAATFASTGTPSFFVHPGEASHGDLGMITRDDVVLAISYSGESAELSDIVAFSRRYGISLIAITRNAESSLGKHADHCLLLPHGTGVEACPMGMAPTTSTTMTLALGDAMAVVLLERRGFSAEDFNQFHPGGALGKRLLRVDEIMTPPPLPLCQPETSMEDVIRLMGNINLGCAGIADETGRLIGIITDGDLRRHFGMVPDQAKARDVMSANPKTIRPDALAQEAARFMNDKSITALFVVGKDSGQPVGLIHIHDCLRAGIL